MATSRSILEMRPLSMRSWSLLEGSGSSTRALAQVRRVSTTASRLKAQSSAGLAEQSMPPLHTPLRGKHLLEDPLTNKGSAFTAEERSTFHLSHLLPYAQHDLATQIHRAEGQMRARNDPLLKYSFLRSLLDQNQVLFYALLQKNLSECLPIIYTPTVGEAIKEYSHIFRRSSGVFISLPDFKDGGAHYLREALTDYGARADSIDLIVVTDGEGILGLGDMGASGISICIGKQAIYTLGAGVDPNRCLNVILDVGTNNGQMLNDPLYLGWRHSRVEGKDYDDLVDTFMDEASKAFPNALIHCEDFGNKNAARLLDKFKPKTRIFNDDIQGTGATALAAFMAATKVAEVPLKEQRIIVQGAGTAGVGIVERIRDAMVQTEGLSKEEANARFYLVDRKGLIHQGNPNTLSSDRQQAFARTKKETSQWKSSNDDGEFSLLDVVKNAQPTALVGTSTVARSFNKDVIEEISKVTKRPIVLPLSNPTRLAEADPHDVTEWSEGRAIIATGSPFPAVHNPRTGKRMEIAELNNALVFPGLGLGAILAKAKRLDDKMIVAGVEALASMSPALKDPDAPLLPDLSQITKVSVKVAAAVWKAAHEDGQAREALPDDVEASVREQMWKPVYRQLEPIQSVG